MDTRTETTGLRLVYPERDYTLSDMVHTLTHLDHIWGAAYEFSQIWGMETDAPDAYLMPVTSEGDVYEYGAYDHVSPKIGRLVMASPLDLHLLLTAAVPLGTGTAGWFAAHLVKKCAKDPTQIGDWLPTLVKAWRHGWAEAELAKKERQAIREYNMTIDVALARMLDASALPAAERIDLVNVSPQVPDELSPRRTGTGTHVALGESQISRSDTDWPVKLRRSDRSL
jgi:hypothetical protein